MKKISAERSDFQRNLRLIAAAALVLRLIVSYEMGFAGGGWNSVFHPSKLSDLATYRDLALNMAHFRYHGEFYYQPFYYAVFLPLVYWIGAFSVHAVIIAQSICGAGAVYLSGLCSGMLFGKKGAYLTAVFCAISSPLLLYTPFHQNETLQSFFFALIACLALRALKMRRVREWAWCGTALSLAILTRGNAWFFVPGLVAALCLSMPGKRKFYALAIFLAAVIVFQLPFAWHNCRVTGKLCGPSTAANAVLALGNTPEAPAGGRNPGLPAGAMEYPESYADAMARAKNGVSLPRQMLAWLKREPAAFWELQFRKLLLFWDGREIPNNVSLYGEGEQSIVLRYLVFGRSSIVLSFALGGMLFLLAAAWKKRSLRMGLLYYLVLAYYAATVLFYILSRFRAPVIPLLTVFAGGGIGVFLTRWKYCREQKQLLFFGCAALLAGCFLVNQSYELYRDGEAGIFRIVRPAGTQYDLLNGRRVMLDHGPFSFGSWCTHELIPGARIGKRFAVSPGRLTGELELTVLAETPGRVELLCRGQRIAEDFSEAGMKKITFPCVLQDGVAEMEVENVAGKLFLLYDAQRNYARSAADGNRVDGEWVMRFRTAGPVSW